MSVDKKYAINIVLKIGGCILQNNRWDMYNIRFTQDILVPDHKIMSKNSLDMKTGTSMSHLMYNSMITAIPIKCKRC